MKKLLYIFLLLPCFIKVSSQQLPLYSQYMMNTFLLNPAAAGAEGYTAVSLTAREQWLGLKDSPKTHALSFQGRILKNNYVNRFRSVTSSKKRRTASGRVGLGGYFFNDKNGLIDKTGFQFTYAYHIPMQDNQLSFGMSVTGFQFRIDEDKMVLYDYDDELINNTEKTVYIPDANFGMQYSTPYFYAGFSASQLFESSLKLTGSNSASYKLERHYYLNSGYKIYKRRWDYMIEPSMLIKFSESSALQLDLSTKVYYKEDYWGGISYRTGAGAGDLILMGGVSVDKFHFGYAFDLTMSSIMKHTYGSHEFMIAVKFGDNNRRYRWLNRY